MNTARKVYKSDESGTVHIEVSGVPPHHSVEVVIVWQAFQSVALSSAAAKMAKRAELEALSGSLADDPLERPEPGVVEARELIR